MRFFDLLILISGIISLKIAFLSLIIIIYLFVLFNNCLNLYRKRIKKCEKDVKKIVFSYLRTGVGNVG